MSIYITKDDLINNAIITDGDYEDNQINWILSFASMRIDNLTNYKIDDLLNGDVYPGTLTQFQQRMILQSALLLAKQVVTYGSDDLMLGSASISIGAVSLSQNNPQDPYYVHPDVYSMLTSAGLYRQTKLKNLEGHRGYNMLRNIDTPDDELTYITIRYAKDNLIGKPIGSARNVLVGIDPIKVELEEPTNPQGRVIVSINNDFISSQITTAIIAQLPNISNLVGDNLLKNSEWYNQISQLVEGIITDDENFAKVMEQAISKLLETDSDFVKQLNDILLPTLQAAITTALKSDADFISAITSAVATALGTNQDFINGIAGNQGLIDAVVAKVGENLNDLLQASFTNLVKTIDFPELD